MPGALGKLAAFREMLRRTPAEDATIPRVAGTACQWHSVLMLAIVLGSYLAPLMPGQT